MTSSRTATKIYIVTWFRVKVSFAGMCTDFLMIRREDSCCCG
jgi:hypothetical protein